MFWKRRLDGVPPVVLLENRIVQLALPCMAVMHVKCRFIMRGCAWEWRRSCGGAGGQLPLHGGQRLLRGSASLACSSGFSVVISGPAAQTRMLMQGDAERKPGIAHPTSRQLSVAKLMATKGGTHAILFPLTAPATQSQELTSRHLSVAKLRATKGGANRSWSIARRMSAAPVPAPGAMRVFRPYQ